MFGRIWWGKWPRCLQMLKRKGGPSFKWMVYNCSRFVGTRCKRNWTQSLPPRSRAERSFCLLRSISPAYKAVGVLSTDCKNSFVMDRVDSKFDRSLENSKFWGLDFPHKRRTIKETDLVDYSLESSRQLDMFVVCGHARGIEHSVAVGRRRDA